MSWAPYMVVPSVAVASRFIPKQHRVNVYVGTLLFYGFVSVIMYNTDSLTDEAPEIIRVSSQRGSER
jgi:hypothetical protein